MRGVSVGGRGGLPGTGGIRLALGAAFALAVLLSACDGSSESVADAPITIESGRPLPASVPRFGLEPEFRIDGYEADLLPITWLGASPAGTTVLLQTQNATIRFFDPEGRELESFGREGDGPGEFRRPVRAGWKGDTLWVSDVQSRRVTLVSPDRELLRTLPPLVAARPASADSARWPTFPFAFPYALYPGDEMFISAIGAAGDPRLDAIGPTPFLRVASDGTIEGVVLPRPENEGSVPVEFDGGGNASLSVPFYPEPMWTVSPDGGRIVTLITNVQDDDGGAFTVRVYDPTGAQLATRAFSFDGETVDAGGVDSILGARAEGARFPEMARAYRTEVPDRVPPVYPPTEDLVVDSDHRIWIRLRATDEGSPWLVLNSDAGAVGRVLLPEDVSVATARGDRVWAVERDELDVESVVRFRLVSDRPGGADAGRAP